MGHKLAWKKKWSFFSEANKTRAKQRPVPGISRGTGPTRGTESKRRLIRLACTIQPTWPSSGSLHNRKAKNLVAAQCTGQKPQSSTLVWRSGRLLENHPSSIHIWRPKKLGSEVVEGWWWRRRRQQDATQTAHQHGVKASRQRRKVCLLGLPLSCAASQRCGPHLGRVFSASRSRKPRTGAPNCQLIPHPGGLTTRIHTFVVYHSS